jgi:hypothetical protein
MNRLQRWKRGQGQSMVEVALTLPLLVVLLVGLVEVAFTVHTYLRLLEASRESARLGARGAADYSNDELRTLTEQNLARQGLAGARLVDIFVVRANIGPGVRINSYGAASMLGSGQATELTQAALLARLSATDPHNRLVAVEILYHHEPLLGFPGISDLFPDPFPLRAYSIMRVLK